jgi:hypothetical protein
MADERANGLRVRSVRGLDRPWRATSDCTTLSSSLSAGLHLTVSSIVDTLRRQRIDQDRLLGALSFQKTNRPLTKGSSIVVLPLGHYPKADLR